MHEILSEEGYDKQRDADAVSGKPRKNYMGGGKKPKGYNKDKAEKAAVDNVKKVLAKETATAGATSAGNVASVVSPHIALGNKEARKKYGLAGAVAKPPKVKMQKPTDNALDMKGTSIFGGAIKR